MKQKSKQSILQIIKLAVSDIQDEAASFVKEVKENYDPNKDDIVTSADKRAQARYVASLTVDFPDFGIIGEEEDLNILCADQNHPVYFTLDPLDGTKAFARHQSHGVATMLALVSDKEVEAAFIADINTNEIYGYYGDEPVTRTRFGVETNMCFNESTKLSGLNALLDDVIHLFPKKLQKLVFSTKEGGLMKGYEISGGSIGLLHARLWKGEIGMLLHLKGYDTPWDSTPLIGINKKLGFVYLKMDAVTGEVEVFEPELPKKVTKKGYVEFIVHKSKVEEVLDFLK